MVLQIPNPQNGNLSSFEVMKSQNLVAWSDVTPPAYSAANVIAPGNPQDLLVALGNRVYLFGYDDYGPAQLWFDNGNGFNDSVWTGEDAADRDYLPLSVAKSGECLYASVAFFRKTW